MAKSKRKHLYSKGGHTYSGMSSLANNSFNTQLYQGINPVEDAEPSNRQLKQLSKMNSNISLDNDNNDNTFLQQASSFIDNTYGPQAFASSAAAQNYGKWAATKAAEQYAKSMSSNAANGMSVVSLGGNAGLYKNAYDAAITAGKTTEEASALASKAVSEGAAKTAGRVIGGVATGIQGIGEAIKGINYENVGTDTSNIMDAIYGTGTGNVNTRTWANLTGNTYRDVNKGIRNSTYNSNALNGNSLVTDIHNNMNLYDTNKSNYKLGFWKRMGRGAKGIGQGALAGVGAGGLIGAAIGAAVGAGENLINNAYGFAEKRKLFGTKNKTGLLEKANNNMLTQASNQASNIANYNVRHDMLNYGTPGYGTTGLVGAQGGQLNLGFAGTNFNNGLTYFNNGGSHEQNINGGVPQGIAPDGQPNLVEEGETKWAKENYIFSKRMKPTKGTMQEANLFKFGGNTKKSYSDLSLDINKEAEERPNDAISIATRDRLLSRLRDAQEYDRMLEQQKQMEELQAMMSQLPPEQQYAMAQQMQQQGEPTQQMQIADPNQVAMEQQMALQSQQQASPQEQMAMEQQNPYSYQDADGAIMAANGGFINLNNSHKFGGESLSLDEKIIKWLYTTGTLYNEAIQNNFDFSNEYYKALEEGRLGENVETSYEIPDEVIDEKVTPAKKFLAKDLSDMAVEEYRYATKNNETKEINKETSKTTEKSTNQEQQVKQEQEKKKEEEIVSKSNDTSKPEIKEESKWTKQSKNRPTYGNKYTGEEAQPQKVHEIGFQSTIDNVFSKKVQEIKDAKTVEEQRQKRAELIKDWNAYNTIYAELAQMSKEDLQSDEGKKKVKAMQERFQEMGLNASLADKAVQEQMDLITEPRGVQAAADVYNDGTYGKRTDARYLGVSDKLANEFNSVGINYNNWDNDKGAWFHNLNAGINTKYQMLNPEYDKALREGRTDVNKYIDIAIPENMNTPELKADWLKANGYLADGTNQDINTDYNYFKLNPDSVPASETTDNTANKFTPLPTWLRGVGAIAPFFFANQKSDYSNANMIKAPTIGYSPVRDYLTYNPLDRQMAIQQLNAQQANVINNIRNTAGGNRAATLAAFNSANSNYFNNFGKLMREADELDIAQREKVAQQNAQVNESNSKGFLKADAANQKYAYDKVLAQANMRHEIDKLTAASNGANLTMGLQNLYGIGTQNANYNMVNGNPAYAAYLDPYTNETKHKSATRGGKLLTKKRGRII